MKIKFLLGIVILFAACTNSKQNENKTVTNDSVKNEQQPINNDTIKQNVDTTLKELEIDEAYFYAGIKKISALKKKEFSILKIKTIDSTFNDPLFKFFSLDTLLNTDEQKVLLIAREYENENILWLVHYTKQNQIKEKVIVYYDNIEGFLTIESKIKNNTIKITSNETFEEQPKTTITTYNWKGKLILDNKNK